MVSRHPNNWKRVQTLALVLLILAAVAPLPEPLDKTLTLIAAVSLLPYYGVSWWEERREGQADQSSSVAISSSDQT